MTNPSIIKRFLPRTLLGRSLLIIVAPLILLQVILGLIFYENHWDKVASRLARNLAGEIAATVELLRTSRVERDRDALFDIAAANLEIVFVFRPNEILPNTAFEPADSVERILAQAIAEYVGKPSRIRTVGADRLILVDVQLPDGVLGVQVPRKRLFSSTTYVFVLWMIGAAMILFGVATIFMRNQVKAVRRLAIAADSFGKGRDAPHFKPEGAKEVRQAASAFLAMRDRIQRQISQRTEMLAGVSHDLRTPLTRLRLQLAMMRDGARVDDMKKDLEDMEHMLDGYLAFARGAGGEMPRPINLTELLTEVVGLARRKSGHAIDLHSEGDLVVPLMPAAFKRCATNLIDNAVRYGSHVSVRAGRRGDAIEVTIDDDGPGIPTSRREEVFKPFFRLEGSRNPSTGGVGLGLTIARDVLRSHGGDIELDDAPGGGLRARLVLPL